VHKKLLFIICLFLTSCISGSFDITQPFIKSPSEAIERQPERVPWLDYGYEEFERQAAVSDKCSFIYFKNELGCASCYAMDDILKDSRVVDLINKRFTPYKVTDDMPDWERAIEIFNVRHTPAIFIINRTKSKWYVVDNHEGYLGIQELISIMLEAPGCYDSSY